LLTGNGNGNVVAGSGSPTTVYLNFGRTTPGALLAASEIIVPFDCTIKNLYLTTTATQAASGSLVVTLVKNGSDTAITFTIAAGASAGDFSDTTHTVSLTAGDKFAIKLVNNATSSSAGLGAFTAELDRTVS
jgi:hypothetical protein